MAEPIKGTATLADARGHARAQAADVAEQLRTVPSTSAQDLPSGVAAADVLWDEIVPLGGYASRRLSRGARLRVTDGEGDGCVQLLVHNAAGTAERLNVADTVKVQWQAYLDTNALLLSDMGRVLMTIEADTSARHDALAGVTSARVATSKWGDGSASGPTPNARDLLALGVAKFGLDRRDVGPALNIFKGVRVADDGALQFEGAVQAGAYVQLRAECDVLVTVANTPHVLDPRDAYSGNAVRLTAWQASPAGIDNDARRSTPERSRAFENTDEWLLGR